MDMDMHARSPASKHSFCHPEGSHTPFLPGCVALLRDAVHAAYLSHESRFSARWAFNFFGGQSSENTYACSKSHQCHPQRALEIIIGGGNRHAIPSKNYPPDFEVTNWVDLCTLFSWLFEGQMNPPDGRTDEMNTEHHDHDD